MLRVIIQYCFLAQIIPFWPFAVLGWLHGSRSLSFLTLQLSFTFLALQDTPGSSCVILALALESGISPRNPGPFCRQVVLATKS